MGFLAVGSDGFEEVLVDLVKSDDEVRLYADAVAQHQLGEPTTVDEDDPGVVHTLGVIDGAGSPEGGIRAV